MTGFALSKTTFTLIGSPYSLGDSKRGFDCATLVMEFAKKSGMPMPEEWEGFTPSNYALFYRDKPSEAKEVLCLWACSAGEEIPPGKAFAGDILIVRPKGHPKSETPGVVIHAGQDMVMAAFESGVRLFPIRAYNVLKAIRWREKRKKKLITPRMEKANIEKEKA
jgi:hypothetical protein